MGKLKNILTLVFKKPSAFLFIFIIIYSIDRHNRWVDFENGKAPFIYDIDQYYSYLPALFVHNDLSFNYPNDYWTTKLENGNHIPKGTYGMSLMYSPFFLIGHAIAKLGDHKADGYSLPYRWSIHFGSILYSLFGLWFCRKNLLNFFNEVITTITLISIFFGTNLFYYTYAIGEMPHAYLFFLFSLFIYLTIRWYKTGKIKFFFALSFLAGVATLIRPTECLIVLFPFFINLKNSIDLKSRIITILKYKTRLIIAFCLFIFPFFVQMLYWKIYSGHWLFFSYGSDERFFFNDPQIINFLFSFRKGWIIYTPIMAFAVIGILFLRKIDKGLFVFIFVYITIHIYLLSSWWDWSFGGSFGCRALIQHYAFLSFSFAAFIYWFFQLFSSKIVLNTSFKIILCFVFYLLIELNLTQSWQYKYGIIHYEGMTKEAYFYVLNKKDFSPNDFKELERRLKIPDRNEMLKGNRDL